MTTSESGLSELRVDRSQDTIHAKTVDVLREAILNGMFLPGDRLIERVLCETTGVGRSSIREALRQLEAERLVEYTPHRGPAVTNITVHDAQELYEMRAALEGLAVRLFTLRASDQLVIELSETVSRYEQAMERQELDAILQTTDEFFAILFEGAENSLLAHNARVLHAQVRFLRATTTHRQDESQRKKYIQTFRDIVKAIQARDADLAVAASQRHVDHAVSVALSSLRDSA